MKKYLVLLVLAFLSLLTAVNAQTVKRTDKMPGFFIPSNALKTKKSAEKLPPVQNMRYKGQQAPIIKEMYIQEQKKLAEQQKEAERLKKQKELENLAQENLQKYVDSAPEKEDSVQAVSQIHNRTNRPSTQDLIRRRLAKYQEQSAAEQNSETEEENKQKEQEFQITAENQEKFKRIIDEYRSDIRNISQNKPFHNQRLIDMIADYKDTDRKI